MCRFGHLHILHSRPNKNTETEAWTTPAQNGVGVWPPVRPRLQADDLVAEEAPSQSVEQVTTTFADEFAGVTVGDSYQQEQFTIADANTGASLANFLQRPVRIDSFTWNESDPVGVTRTISPWSLFFNDPSIKYKLNNFSFVSCNLKLKIIVNASPFYFGALRACYQPLPVFKPSTVGSSSKVLINFSQQPGLWITPMNSEGGDMTLPFLYQKDYLSVQRLADFTNMGTLRFITYAALDSANGATGVGVSVQVYAWAEDVILSGPSVGLALQADEYGTGVVSRPASAVASVAGALKGIPIIGKFATATEMGAKAIGGIAKLFGFTNVPVIQDTQPYRPSPFPQFASPELGFPVEKLTLDAKNELSIDPSVVGTDSQDTLAIEALASRETFLCSSTWSTTSPVDTPLFTSRVTPWLFDINGTRGAAGTAYHMSPMALTAACFGHWRGDIIFRFMVVCSKYHKGRLRVSYDPVNPAVQTTGDTGPLTFNKIVDLGTESEFEIRVPFHQALAWLRTDTSLTSNHWSTVTNPTLTADTTATNGILSLKVLTLLTAPVVSSSVSVLVFVRAADNLEFANPTNLPRLSPFTVQSADYVPGSTGQVDMSRYRINFGECVKSLRPLLRRSVPNEIWYTEDTAPSAYYWRTNAFRYPKAFGYDPSTPNRAKGVITTGTTYPFNYSPLSPYTLVSNCFIGQRGAIMWHLVPDTPKPLSNLRTVRQTEFNVTSLSLTSASAITTGTGTFNSTITWNGSAGLAVVNCSTVNGLSVSIPNYTQYKFQSTRPDCGTKQYLSDLDRTDGGELESWRTDFNGISSDILPATVKIHTYFGVGTDYSLIFFLNVPTMYAIPNLPSPT